MLKRWFSCSTLHLQISRIDSFTFTCEIIDIQFMAGFYLAYNGILVIIILIVLFLELKIHT